MTALRALLVEDSENDALLVLHELRRGFARVEWKRVDTQAGFLAALAEGSWNVIISDHRMPRFSSTEALSTLQAAGHDVPFIIVSGSIGTDTAVLSMKAGASDYLLKNDLGRLVPAIEREIRDADGRAARRRAEESLHQLEIENRKTSEAAAVKAQFLAKISHELRTPLNSIIGFSDLLIDGPSAPPEKQARYAQNINQSGRHLLALINDLLDLSKIEAGKLSVTAEPCDVLALLRDALGTLLPVANAREVQLSLSPPAGPIPLARGDVKRVIQVLYNLISNAIKFTPAAGQVVLGCSLSHGSVRSSVADSGPGISEADLRQLFVPYGQLENAREQGGSGLGLAVAKELAELMGGSVGAESTLGRGSTFFLELPLWDGETTA